MDDSGTAEALSGMEAQRGAMLEWVNALAPFGIFTTDTDLNVRSWNQWLVNHGGRTAEEVLGRNLTELFPELVERRLAEHFRRALDGEVSVLSTALHRYLLAFPAPGRTDVNARMLQTVRIAPLVHGDSIVGTIATIEDVTQRETHAVILRKQQEHDRLLSSSLALLLSSENPLQSAAELFPKLAAPLKLEVYFHFVLSPDASELRLHAASGITPEVRKAFAVLKVGEGACGTVAALRKPLVATYVQESTVESLAAARRMGLRTYAAFPLLVGDRLLGTLSFGSYARDVIAPDDLEFLSKVAQYVAIAIERALRENALRQAQQSLSEHADELETKIAERTARLHETIVQLESFSYTVAHDLRAPIRSLKGYSEILLNDYAASIPEDGQALLRRLKRASHRLDALTRDLLAFSKIARQDVQLDRVDVGEVVDEIIHATPTLQSVITVLQPLGHAMAQRTLLQQCLSNLFDNALKFSRPGVPARIVVRSERQELPPRQPAPGPAAFSPSIVQRADASAPPFFGGHVLPVTPPAPGPRLRIWVEDNGIGIPPQAHEKIFGIFERVSGLENVEGTGIGLAIVARATQQMGGACGVESEPGKGSQFWLDLITAPPPA
jgi:PAS domain S-box-containing protein